LEDKHSNSNITGSKSMMKLISSQMIYYEINLLWKCAFVPLTNAQQHSIHMSHKVLTKLHQYLLQPVTL